ncbi:hypothetical protein Goklo_005964 [Gossypium klotzschianum]|uniref:Uncharacterized protein n=1 Tax=Gossypium klotzschianum TaxID=34286 RepID=A0A7J8VGC9_9ROSI|nr:hypothetical protein [Gossypium klotzschianum]
MCSIALLQSIMLMLQTLCKSFLTILNSCLMSMLRTSNQCLPLWPRVPMFRIMILMILVCINSMLIGLIWEDIMMRNQSLS